MMRIRLSVLASILFGPFAMQIIGCGEIVDPDNIVVAKLDGSSIRQGELDKHLRRLSEADRPLIQSKADLVDALNKFINDQILEQHAEELGELNLISVPRDIAKQAYFAKNPDDIFIYEIPDPALIGRTEAELAAIRAQAEFGIDDEQARLLRETALAYLTRDAIESGELMISDEEYGAEYAFREDELHRNETLDMVGIRFPVTLPDAAAQATAVRQRIEKGAAFADMVEEFRNRNPDLILESTFENNPAAPMFAPFWETASSSEIGTVLLGFLPPFTVEEERGGIVRAIEMPAAHLVFKVVNRTPEKLLTLEEAKPILAVEIYRRKMMNRLRDQHGVEIFPDALSDPAGVGGQFKGSIIKTSP